MIWYSTNWSIYLSSLCNLNSLHWWRTGKSLHAKSLFTCKPRMLKHNNTERASRGKSNNHTSKKKRGSKGPSYFFLQQRFVISSARETEIRFWLKWTKIESENIIIDCSHSPIYRGPRDGFSVQWSCFKASPLPVINVSKKSVDSNKVAMKILHRASQECLKHIVISTLRLVVWSARVKKILIESSQWKKKYLKYNIWRFCAAAAQSHCIAWVLFLCLVVHLLQQAPFRILCV